MRNRVPGYVWLVIASLLLLPFPTICSPLLPYSAFRIIGPESTCAGSAVTLTTSGCEGSLRWSTGQAAESITITPLRSTTYYAICNTLPGQVSASHAVVVFPKPFLSTSSANLYSHNQVVITAEQVSTDAPVIWKKDDIILPFSANSLLANEAGTYHIENAVSAQWLARAPIPFASEMRAVVFTDSLTGYTVGREGNAYRTTDGGNFWYSMNLETTADLEDVFFADSLTGWIVSSSRNAQLFKTMDGGTTWAETIVANSSSIQDMHFSNRLTGWLVGANGLIMHTRDGGSTWHSQPSGIYQWLYSVSFANDTLGVAVGENGIILQTTNGGTDWTAQNSGTSQSLNAVRLLNDSTGWGAGLEGTLLKTADGGRSWAGVTSYTSENLSDIFLVNESTVWISTYEGSLLHTVDGGVFFTKQSNPDLFGRMNALYFNGQRGFAVGSGGRIVRTINGGTHWALYGSALRNDLAGTSFRSSSLGWAVGSNGYIGKTTDGGQSWLAQGSGTSVSLRSVHFVTDDWGWAIGPGIILHTDNGGATWQHQDPGFYNGLHDVFALNASQAWVAGGQGTVRHTTTGGNEWLVSYIDVSKEFYSIHFVSSQKGWVAGSGGAIYTTTDGGITWTAQNSGTAASLQSVFFINDTLGIASGGDQTLRTIDGGTTWTALPIQAGFKEVYINPQGIGWGISTAAAYYTSDFGASWILSGSFSLTYSIRAASIPDATSAGFAVGLNGFVGKLIPATNCQSNSITITSGHSPDFTIVSESGPALCQGKSTQLTALGCTETLRWSTGDSTATLTVAPNFTTTYRASCRAEGGIELIRSYTVKVFAKPYISSAAASLCAGTPLVLQSGLTPVRWARNGQFLPSASGSAQITVRNEGRYTAENIPKWTPTHQFTTTEDFQDITFGDTLTGYAVGNRGALFKTIDGGNRWLPLFINDTELFISTHFVNDSTGWILTHTGKVYRTTNGGSTWASSMSGATPMTQTLRFSDASHGWVVGNNGSIAHSADGGTTWTLQASGSSHPLSDVYFLDSLAGWAVGKSGTFLQTKDGGHTWTSSPAFTSQDLTGVQFLTASEGWLTGTGLLLYTADSGATWRAPTLERTFSQYHGLHFIDRLKGWVVADESVLYTQDGGKSWHYYINTATPFAAKAIHFTTEATGHIAAPTGKLLKTTDGGISWQWYGSSLREPLTSVSFVDSLRGWAGTRSGTLYQTTDGGRQWQIKQLLQAPISTVHFTGKTTGWITDGNVRHSTDGGQTWPVVLECNECKELFATDSLHAWTAKTNGSIKYTADGGTSWQGTQLPGAPYVSDLFFINNQTGWLVGSQGAIRKTTDGGATWTSQNSRTSAFLNSVYFMNETIGIAGGDGVLLRTTNGGASWTSVSTSYNPIQFLYLAEGGIGWMSVGTKMYFSTDAGLTWAQGFDTGNPLLPLLAGSFLQKGSLGWAVGASGYMALLDPPGTCAASDTLLIATIPSPPVLTASDTLVAAGDSVLISASNCRGTVVWSDSIVGHTRTEVMTTTRNFAAFCLTPENCRSPLSDTLTLSVAGPAMAHITGDRIIQSGQTTTVTITLSGTAPWNFVFDGKTYSNVYATTHQLTVAPIHTQTYVVNSVSNREGPGTTQGSATIYVYNVCDTLEPNNTFQTAYKIIANPYSSPPVCLNTPTDNDWFTWMYNGRRYYILVHPYAYNGTGNYRFTLTLNKASGQLILETLPVNGSTTDTYLRLYGSDGTTQLAFDDDGGVGGFSKIVYTLPPCDSVVETQQSGSWTDPYVWACEVVPTALDAVRINSGHSITLPENHSAPLGSLEIKGELLYKVNSTLRFGQ